MILSAETIRKLNFIHPLRERGRTELEGPQQGLSVSHGLGNASYDISSDQHFFLDPGQITLVSTIEKFYIPENVAGFAVNKSTWFRLGAMLIPGFVDPGWRGHMTVAFYNAGRETIIMPHGAGICQVVFEFVDQETHEYEGKYQDQARGVVEAR